MGVRLADVWRNTLGWFVELSVTVIRWYTQSTTLRYARDASSSCWLKARCHSFKFLIIIIHQTPKVMYSPLTP